MCSTRNSRSSTGEPTIRRKTSTRTTTTPSSHSTRPSSASKSPSVFSFLDFQQELFRYFSCEATAAAQVRHAGYAYNCDGNLNHYDAGGDGDGDDQDYYYRNDSSETWPSASTTSGSSASTGSSSSSFSNTKNKNDRNTVQTCPDRREDDREVEDDGDQQEHPPIPETTSQESTVMVMYYDKKGNLRSSDERTHQSQNASASASKAAATATATTKTAIAPEIAMDESLSMADTVLSSSSESSSFSLTALTRRRDGKCRLINRLKEKQEREQRFQQLLLEEQKQEEELEEELEEQKRQQEEEKDAFSDQDSVSTTSSHRRRIQRRERNLEIIAMTEFTGFVTRAKKKEKKPSKLNIFRKRPPSPIKQRRKKNNKATGGDLDSVVQGGPSVSSTSVRSGKSLKSLRSNFSRSSTKSKAKKNTNANGEPVSILRRSRSMPNVKHSGCLPTADNSPSGVRFAEGTVFLEPKFRKKVPRIHHPVSPTRKMQSRRNKRALLAMDHNEATREGQGQQEQEQPSMEAALTVLSSDESSPYASIHCNPIEDMVPLLTQASSMDCYIFR